MGVSILLAYNRTLDRHPVVVPETACPRSGLVFVRSSFLDNIAAAPIGHRAKIVFPTVHIGYLAAIVAASNAGGAGSVVGDTTTTMM